MMKHVICFFTLFFLVLELSAQPSTYYPVDLLEVLIENKELDSIDVYTAKRNGKQRRLKSRYAIDRSKREIITQHYSRPDGSQSSTAIIAYNEDWKAVNGEGKNSDGQKTWSIDYQYDNGLLTRIKGYQLFPENGDQESVELYYERVYEYSTAHDHPLFSTNYRGWDREEVSSKNRFDYDFDDEGRVTYQSRESYDPDRQEYVLREEYFWDYWENKTRHEHYLGNPNHLNSVTVKTYRENQLISESYKNHGDKSSRRFRMGYNEEGFVETLEQTNNRKLSEYLIYEYY